MVDKEILDKVASSCPVNKTAKLVISKGVNYKPICKYNGIHCDSLEPLVMRNVPRNLPNKIGIKFGSFTVVGLFWKIREIKSKKSSGSKSSGEKNKWVCKCVCGRYETRKTRSINKTIRNRSIDMCAYCRLDKSVLARNIRNPNYWGS